MLFGRKSREPEIKYDPDRQYANALFFFIFSVEDVTRLKQIWNKRECVFTISKSPFT